LKFSGHVFPHEYVLNISPRLIWELLGRWGNGSSWAIAYGLCLVAGVVAIVRRWDASLALVLWFVAPFAFYSLVPFGILFDIRYLIGCLPPFFLIVGAGIVSIASLARRPPVRSWWPLWLDRAGPRNVVAGLVTMCFLVLSIDTYLEFRVFQRRCQSVGFHPDITKPHDGFCMKYLVLNSLYREHSFLLTEKERSR
jgi:hypothetical protein